MARMLYLNERLWFSSTLTLPTLIASAFSRAISSSKGAIILHGPHHSAQKSTTTGLSLCMTSRSKFDSSRLMAVELLSIALGKISPNLNNQNDGRTGEHRPAGRHRNCIHHRIPLGFLRRRHRNWSDLGCNLWHRNERLRL